ncbi:hypothetical protein Scep_022566 [Stephania cephalantha]|uniref:Uncharacterized protein n=1 Tax=Stephania cephalantha TaxID=152367 RepID=A0AAP0FBH7_9MAGN
MEGFYWKKQKVNFDMQQQLIKSKKLIVMYWEWQSFKCDVDDRIHSAVQLYFVALQVSTFHCVYDSVKLEYLSSDWLDVGS